jgi:hypothetical protein
MEIALKRIVFIRSMKDSIKIGTSAVFHLAHLVCRRVGIHHYPQNPKSFEASKFGDVMEAVIKMEETKVGCLCCTKH